MSRWLRVDLGIGTLAIEFNQGRAFLHTEFHKPVAAMRTARKLFPQVKAWLKRMGHDVVYVLIPEGDELLLKFERSFGFEERARFAGQILLSQEC